MTQDELKQLQKLIKEELRPLKDLAELTKRKVDKQELFIQVASENTRTIKEQQSVMNEKLDGLEEGVSKLDKKTDTILKFAEEVDKVAFDHEKRLRKIESIPVIAQNL